MALEPCPREGTMAFTGRCRASTPLRPCPHPAGDGLSGGGQIARLFAGLEALSMSTNIRQQKTPESSMTNNPISPGSTRRGAPLRTLSEYAPLLHRDWPDFLA